VTTVARPETDYRGPGLYDMEAAGFFAVAARAAPAELVHAYKIVSDGPESSIGETTPERAAAAIEARLRTIGQLIERLRASAEELAAAEADPPHFARTIEDRRFTATERVQLRRLLRRWAALLPDADPWPTESGRPRRAREALDRLRERLDATPVRID
jgi:hypothetical protein